MWRDEEAYGDLTPAPWAFREAKMTRLAALLWIMGGTVLAGVLVVVVLMIPSIQAEAMRYIPIAAIVGYALGIPLALVAAKGITHSMR
jgi:hypothetical protein